MTSVKRLLTAFTLFILSSSPLLAERIVLAPGGLVVPYGHAEVEYVFLPNHSQASMSWLTGGLPVDWQGTSTTLELEVERDDLPGFHRDTVSLQLSPFGNGFIDIAPAISFGVRDLLNQGREGRAFFIAATKSIGLNTKQAHYLRRIDLNVGVGTSRLDGLYGGLAIRFPGMSRLAFEIVGQRFNESLALPVGPQLRLEAYSIGGELFYGAMLKLK